MPYTPQTWVDGPGGGTPISAARLTHIEEGISAVDAAYGLGKYVAVGYHGLPTWIDSAAASWGALGSGWFQIDYTQSSHGEVDLYLGVGDGTGSLIDMYVRDKDAVLYGQGTDGSSFTLQAGGAGDLSQLAIQPSSGQTNPLLNLMDSNGSGIFQVLPSGVIYGNNGTNSSLLQLSGATQELFFQPSGGGSAYFDVIVTGNSLAALSLRAGISQTDPLLDFLDSGANSLFSVRPQGDGVLASFNDSAGNSRVQILTDPDAALQAISVHSETLSEASGDWGATDLSGIQFYMEGKVGGNAVDYLYIASSGGTNRLFAVTPTAALDFLEQTTPDAPPANTARLYTKDVGGKTGLYVLFPSGAEQQIKVEV